MRSRTTSVSSTRRIFGFSREQGILGELNELYEAVYHSAVNFASLGYGDFVMSKNRKLLGPLEAVNGVIMLGMTSAAMMVILQQVIKDQRDEIMASAGRSSDRDR